jgi:hypothetical protein
MFQDVATTYQSWYTDKIPLRICVRDHRDLVRNRPVDLGRPVARVEAETMTATPLAQEPQEVPVPTSNLDHILTAQVVALNQLHYQGLGVVAEAR